MVEQVEDGTVVERIVEEIAEREEVEPTELSPPLQTVVDTDALEALFTDSIDGGSREGIEVTFTYAGYTVGIEEGGESRIFVQ